MFQGLPVQNGKQPELESDERHSGQFCSRWLDMAKPQRRATTPIRAERPRWPVPSVMSFS